LSDNAVESIGNLENTKGCLANLEHLSISQNLLRTWTEIDNLAAWCPCLKVLNMADNPLMQGIGELGILTRS
jgi:hypothetical protein